MTQVVIDIGHGGRDSGAVGATTYEKNNNLVLGLKIGKILQRHGITVNFTRADDRDFCESETFDVNVDLQNRIAIAKSYNPDVFISCHNNSFNQQAKGLETHCYKSGGTDEQLATCIQNQMVSALGMIDRGVKISNLYVTRKFDKTKTSACLVEYGFIDSEEDVILSKMDIASVAIAKGILEFLGIQYVEEIVNNNQGDEFHMDCCIVYFSPADFSSALILSNLNGGCGMFCRNASASVHPDVFKASKIIVVGGPKLGVVGEIYLSGDKASDTLIAVSNYLQGK